MKRAAASTVALAATAAAALSPWTAVRADPGLEATLSISQGIKSVDRSGRVSSSDDDEGVSSTTSLDFGLTSVTTSQRLSFQAGTELDYNPDAADTLSPSREQATLDYQIESRQSVFNTSLAYRSIDVEDSVFLDELTGEDVIVDRGRRDIRSLSTGLVMGREAPLSVELRQRYSESGYSGTTDPDLRDSTTQSVDAVARMQVSPVLSLETNASWKDMQQDGPDGNSRTTQQAGIGATYELSPATSATAGLNYSINETDDDDDQTEGLGYNLGLHHARPNGTIDLGLSTVETVNGTRSQFTLGRSLDFRWGSASLTVGATKTGDLNYEPLINGRLAYTLDQASSLNLGVSQASITNSDNQETLRTQLSVGYSRELTQRSRLNGTVRLSDRNVLGAGTGDQSVLRADLNYAHEVGDDWSLVSGYEYSRISEELAEDRKTNTVFLKLEKTFSYRP